MNIKNKCNVLPQLHNITMYCESILNNSDQVVSKFEDARNCSNIDYFELCFEVFLQTWANTSCGIGACDGEFYGQAITDAYTVVCHEIITDSYIVFYGNLVGYLVTDPSSEFLDDLKNHDLKDVEYAKIHY